MRLSTAYAVLVIAVGAMYFYASKSLFVQVNKTSKTVIDELFHIPQGLAFCKKNFSYWDPKITTLPGLYLVSATFIGSYFPCDVYSLRFVNLAASVVNFFLFASIMKFVYGSYSERPGKIVLQALNLTMLPPLYFFSHLYYTDTLSLTFLLAFWRLCFVNKHKILILFLGCCSVLMRQTNIVWVGMVLGYKILDILIKSSRVFGNTYLTNMTLSKKSAIARDVDSSKLRRYYTIFDLYLAVKYHISTGLLTFFKFLTVQDFLILLTHSVTLGLFVAFVIINGSIVVGDKKAHEASIHIPQMFYFLLFYGVFGLPYVLAKMTSTLRLMYANKFKVILFSIAALAIVHFNTVVHPYLLADNRHYTFYIWNRWYGKYDFAKYVTVPLYMFLLFSLYDNLRGQNCISFLLPYTVCTFAGLALQRMIEVRYFLIPYIVLRLRFSRPSYKIVSLEFVWYLLINAATFYIFFTKEIKWKDFDDIQRIIW